MARPPDDMRDRLEVAILQRFNLHLGLSADGQRRLLAAQDRIHCRMGGVTDGWNRPIQLRILNWAQECRRMYEEVYRGLGPAPEDRRLP